MSDSFRKVRSGQPLSIPASAYNAFIDAAQAHKDRRQDAGQNARDRFRDGGVVLVKNNTGGDLSRFSVVGLDDPIILPADSFDGFANRVAFGGSAPAAGHEGRFAVLLDAVPDGQCGQAMVSGVIACPVYVADASHVCADIAAGETDYLASAESGAAQILWRPDGPGVVWAVVKLSIPASRTYIETVTEEVGGDQGWTAPHPLLNDTEHTDAEDYSPPTAGDVIRAETEGEAVQWKHLPIGATDQVLTVVDGLPEWADPPAGSGGLEGTVYETALHYHDDDYEEIATTVASGDLRNHLFMIWLSCSDGEPSNMSPPGEASCVLAQADSLNAQGSPPNDYHVLAAAGGAAGCTGRVSVIVDSTSLRVVMDGSPPGGGVIDEFCCYAKVIDMGAVPTSGYTQIGDDHGG